FLEAVRLFEVSGGVVLKLGKLRLVDRVRFVAWLARREQAAAHPDGADALAAELGLVAGGKP
ncbi:MAG: hypothetical protein NUW01_09545, partial [Gemmatimonadaceae bacterium]|nr:hypothetical protein [Gemmatimonadaceae bacterium]